MAKPWYNDPLTVSLFAGGLVLALAFALRPKNRPCGCNEPA